MNPDFYREEYNGNPFHENTRNWDSEFWAIIAANYDPTVFLPNKNLKERMEWYT